MPDHGDTQSLKRREKEGIRERAEPKRGSEALERICRDLGPAPRGLDRAKERLSRMERIAERDSMRHLRDYDPRRAKKLEDFEIKTNLEGFARRHQGEGLDEGTRRELCRAVRDEDDRG